MRTSDTYRGRRRNDWAAGRSLSSMPWREWNAAFHGRSGFSIPERLYPPSLVRVADRSKYMPHIGAKERGRYAA